MSNELLALFRKTAALLDGSFILRSGLHSRQFFQCALLLQQTEVAARPCGTLADKARGVACDAMISPPLGGIIAGQEVGRPLKKRHILRKNMPAAFFSDAESRSRLTINSSSWKTWSSDQTWESITTIS